MSFVQRDQLGAVCGVFANRQEGYAEEQLDDAAPEIVAFIAANVVHPPGPIQPPESLKPQIDALTQQVTELRQQLAALASQVAAIAAIVLVAT